MQLIRRQFLFLAGAAIAEPALGQGAKLTLSSSATPKSPTKRGRARASRPKVRPTRSPW